MTKYFSVFLLVLILLTTSPVFSIQSDYAKCSTQSQLQYPTTIFYKVSWGEPVVLWTLAGTAYRVTIHKVDSHIQLTIVTNDSEANRLHIFGDAASRTQHFFKSDIVTLVCHKGHWNVFITPKNTELV